MKKIYWIIGIIIIFLIAIILITVFFYEVAPHGAVPLNGWLIKVNVNTEQVTYFVAEFFDENTHAFYNKVLTEDQIKKITKLYDIYPITTQTQLTSGEAKNIATKSESIIADEPILRYDTQRKPLYWIVSLFYTNGTCHGIVGIGDVSKTIEWGAEGQERCDMLFTEEKGKNVLYEYMRKNNIEGTIIEVFYFQYLVQDLDALREYS